MLRKLKLYLFGKFRLPRRASEWPPRNDKCKLLLFVASSIVVFTLVVPHAQAAIVNCGNGDGGHATDSCKFSDFFSSAAELINYLLSGAAVIAVGGVIYGAYLMVFSAGNQTRQTTGRKAVTGSLIGLAIILVSYLAVRSLFSILGFKGGTSPVDNPIQFVQPGSGVNITPPPAP